MSENLITTSEENEMDDINIENTISKTDDVVETELEEVQAESEEVETTEPEEMAVEVEEGEEDRSVSSEIAYRTIDLSKASYIDEENRTVRIGVSSEQPVSRSFGLEVLDHKRESIDTAFMDSKTAPFLLDHDMSQVIGVVEDFKIDETAKRTTAVVRFGKGELASEIFEDVKDGIRKNISVGYKVNKMERDSNDIIGDHYRATSWSPMEISSVSIPADQSVLVGVGRKNKQELNFKDIKMSEENKIDSNAIRSEATESAKAEMLKNAKEISALGKHHGQRDLADNAIQNGMSVEQFRGVLLDNISNDKPLDVAPATVGLNQKEKGEYSLIRAINAATTGDWSKAGYERELSEDIAQRAGKEARGFYMPSDLNWGQRDQTVSPTSAGGFLVGTDHLADQFISALYAKLTVGELGARVMTGLKGNISVPKLSAQTTNTAFVAEGGAPTEGAATFSNVTLEPRTLASYVDCSRKLMLQSDPSVEAVLRNDIISQFARKIDSVAINGGGSNEPSGIIPGVPSGNVVAMGTNGLAPTYAKIVELIKAVDVSNAMGGNPSFLTNPKVVAALRTIAKQSGGAEGNFIMEAASDILGYNIASTTLVPSNLAKGTGSNLSAAIFGDFTNVMLGFWSGVDVVVDTSSLSTSGGTRLAFFQDLDVGIRHGEGFSVIKDIIA